MTQVIKQNGSSTSFSYYYHDKYPRSSGRTTAREQRNVTKPEISEKRRFGYRIHRNDSGSFEEETLEDEEEIRIEEGAFEGWQERIHKKNDDKSQPQEARPHETKKSEHLKNIIDKKKPNLQNALQRGLSNYLPLNESSSSTTDEGERSRRSKTSPKSRQTVKSGYNIGKKKTTSTGEGYDSDPSTSNNQFLHKGKVAHPKRATNDNDNSNDSSSVDIDPSTNVDETGNNAKLLAIRRIGSPSDKDGSIEPNVDNDRGDSTSSSIQDGTSDAPDVFLPKRYILAIMMFMGFVNMYAVRVNLNVAIGAMANNHTVVRNGVAVTVVCLI